ncbi:MAG: hypothetical protein ACHQ51_00985 [Elusimicrobiota bacterium]
MRLVLAAVAALFFMRMLVHVDPDVFFHLKEGGRVLSEHRLPLVEEYSFTRAGKAMVATEWLSGAAFAAAFRLGGYPAVVVLNVLLIVGALRLMTKIWDEEGPPESARALLTALAAFALLSFAQAKVQNFTFLFFALYLFWVRRWEKGARWAPWAMAGGLAIWVNLHGGFTLGWVLLGAVCALDYWKEKRPSALAPWAAGTFACFLHPNGAMAFVYPIWFVFAAPAARSLIVEWRPLGWAWSSVPYLFVLAAALYFRIDRLRSRFPWAFLGFVFLVMGLRARKMMPYFALVECAAAGLALAGTKSNGSRKKWMLAGTVTVLAAITAVELSEARGMTAYGPISDWEREFPREAVQKYIARDSGKRIFHAYEWGGYLTYKLPPGDRVFIDGRLDPYWTLLTDYEILMHAAPGWEKLAADYGIEAALLPPASSLARALDRDPGWKAVGTDGRAALYERRGVGPKKD